MEREMISEETTENSINENGGYVVRGISNLGNTCYCNSIMQNLLSMDRLRSYFLKLDDFCGPLTVSLKKLLVEPSPESLAEKMLNPSSFFECLRSICPQFKKSEQHDSHEFLRCLLDGLREEVGPTFVDTIFGGQIASTVCCTECGHSSTVYDPFLDLSIEIPIKRPLNETGADDNGLDLCNLSADCEIEKGKIVKDWLHDGSNEVTCTSHYNDTSGIKELEKEINEDSCSKNSWDEELPLEYVQDFSNFFCEDELPLDKVEAPFENSWEDELPLNMVLASSKNSWEGDDSSVVDRGHDSSDFIEPGAIDTVSCLSHFTALDIFSDEQAWPCENCSKIIQKEDIKPNITTESDSTNIQETKQENEFSQREESLNEPNGQICDTHMKVKKGATKRFLIDKAPPILTVHLKRFVQDDHGSLSKLNGHVGFGETLDLLPFMDPRYKESENYTYKLLGVVEHSGTMKCGHYVAYVRGRISESAEKKDGWVYASDDCVRQVELEEVLGCEAYILFYEKN